jgi:hydrogenase 3 maturation protease
MSTLREQLHELRRGRVCLVGVGNVELGDDGFGVRLTEKLGGAEFASESLRVVVAGCEPEHQLSELCGREFDTVLFLDAVEFGGEPGAVVLLDASAMLTCFPQISTHKLSLGLLARMIEAGGATKAWLLGVQPESLRPGTGLSPRVQASADLLSELLAEDVSARTFQTALPC